MNLEVYVQSLKRTAANLGAVLRDWSELDDSLKSHYVDELVRLLAEREEALETARKAGTLVPFAQTITAVVAQSFIPLAPDILEVTGVDVIGFLLGPAVSLQSDESSIPDGPELAFAA